MKDEGSTVIDWPDQEAEDAFWDKAYDEYVNALFVRDDRYSSDTDRMMTLL